MLQQQKRSGRKYKFLDREYEDSFGLNIYEMDLRQLDPALGHWVVQDPVIHHDYSPYSAFDNNPVYWSDPSGADAVQQGANFIFTGADAKKFFELYTGKADSSASAEEEVKEVYEVDMKPNEMCGPIGIDGGPGKGRIKERIQEALGKLDPSFLEKKRLHFSDSPIRVWPGDFGSASYFGGAINTSEGYWNRFLNNPKELYSSIGFHFMHEFGHYLQEAVGGAVKYNGYTAWSSLFSFNVNDREGHSKHWTEVEASTLAYFFFGKPEGFLNKGEDNVINENQSRQMLINLYNQFNHHPDYKP